MASPVSSDPLEAFQDLVRAITRCVEDGLIRSIDDPFQIATLVWAEEHGVVSLRISRPSFPWPPLDVLIDELLARLVGLSTDRPGACAADVNAGQLAASQRSPIVEVVVDDDWPTAEDAVLRP